jgi:hypothetical protein
MREDTPTLQDPKGAGAYGDSTHEIVQTPSLFKT